MKTIFALCGLILLAGGFWLYRTNRTPMTYGQFTNAPAAQVAQLIDQPKANMGKTWTIEGIIQDQCTTMGCYFFFKENGKSLRVELQEIAMYAPRNRNGKPARVEGRIVPYGDGYQFWASAVDFK